MKAIRVAEFGGPGVLQMVEMPEPVPGPGEVRVRLRAIGVNPVETYIRAGVYAHKPALPYTPGGDGAGVVDAVGSGVTGIAVGDRVYTSGSLTGTYAEYAVCAAARVHALPDAVTFAQGAAIGVPYGTAYRAVVQRGGLLAGECVLVHGASGGVGTAAVQIARALGAFVIGTAGTTEGCALVTAQGAHAVVNHREGGYLERIRGLAEARGGVQLVVEMLANVNLGHDLGLLGPRGRVVVVGSRGPVEINPRALMGCDGDIRAMTLFNVAPEDYMRIHAALFAGLESGALRPVVGRELALADAAEAHRAVIEDRAYGKIVLLP
ncbi:NADPH:quinone reductase [Opitutales bacterium ASA1]|uniref:NADPH:quinone reductase n=1 Tax=Congregicoccus parvus TaxID=3081749 RepID=UPI002B2C8FD6|nr:NADPH:quinone reductase [Opitutales bacterium ASA1]